MDEFLKALYETFPIIATSLMGLFTWYLQDNRKRQKEQMDQQKEQIRKDAERDKELQELKKLQEEEIKTLNEQSVILEQHTHILNEHTKSIDSVSQETLEHTKTIENMFVVIAAIADKSKQTLAYMLKRLYDQHMIRGYITSQDLKEWNDLYAPYRELNGNGVVEQMNKGIQTLPIDNTKTSLTVNVQDYQEIPRPQNRRPRNNKPQRSN